MNEEMMELYQQVILDHNKHPRNFRKLEDLTHQQEGHNPLCGDHLFVYLRVDKESGKIEDIGFEGDGCAISKASASMMTEAVKGKTISQVEKIFVEFRDLLLKKLDPENDPHDLGKLELFSGIWKFPARVKCAGLAWHTLDAALKNSNERVKTE